MTTPTRNIAIVGAGAMGAMYATHFARAGFDIRFVANGQRAARLEGGIRVNNESIDISVVRTDAPLD